MLLPISSIKPAPDPIRKTWDEDKLNELAQSIAEQGLIVPIKVRPHPELRPCRVHGFAALSKDKTFDDVEKHSDCMGCDNLQQLFWGEHEHEWFEYEEGEIEPVRPFEVVYGHRRLEASRRNGATEIECIVEALDDTHALVQGLIENLQREDIGALDKGKAIRELQRLTGWSIREINRRGIATRVNLENWVNYLAEHQAGSIPALIMSSDTDSVTQVSEVRHSFSLAGRSEDTETKRAVLEKSAAENLNWRETRRVADAVNAAPSPEAKKMLLETEYSPALHDPEHIKSRAATYGAHDPLYRTDNGKTQQKAWDNTPEVKMIIDGVINAAKSWTMLIAEIRRMVQVGKMAPEGRQFTASKLRTLAQTLSSFADELEQEQEREHA